MLAFLHMALRNVGRNKRRTLITVVTIVLGTVVVVLTRGLLNGLQGELIQNLTRKVNGDLQIHREGYKDNLDANPFDYLVSLGEGEKVAWRATTGIDAASGRLRVFGLINNQRTQKTTPVFLTGIDSRDELAVCPRLADAVESGELLDSANERRTAPSLAPDPKTLEDAPELGSDPDPAAAALASSDGAPQTNAGVSRHQVLLTPSLARGLQAELGDEMVILLKDAANMEQALVGTFVGTIDLNLPMAGAKSAWVDLTTLQDILSLQGKVSEIAFRVDADVERGGDAALVGVQERAQARQDRVEPGYIVERWDQTMGFFTDVMGLQNAVFKVVLAIMFVIVSSAIVNTSMMTVSERVREIGTLMAIGYKRRHILTIFILEASAIGVLGGISGLIIGLLALFGLRAVGLRFSFPGTDQPFLITPFVSAEFALMVLAIAIASALVAALYPSYRASRLKPVEALTSN